MTLEQVRKDLIEIRDYYSMEEYIKKTSCVVVPEGILKKVDLYNKAMSNCPTKLFMVFVALYVQNNSQQAVADDWGFCREHVRRLNKKLCEFLVKALIEIEEK